jgi:uncharacterized protein YrrD
VRLEKILQHHNLIFAETINVREGGDCSLRTFSLLKEAPVFQISNGKTIGCVKDLCLNNEGEIKGLIVNRKRLFSKKAILPIEHVQSFGLDGIIVENETCLQVQKDKSDHLFTHPHRGILGKPLLTAEGEKLGLVEDVYFNEELGTILGYEVTEGFFADLKEGRKVVKTDKPLVYGKDVLFVHMK